MSKKVLVTWFCLLVVMFLLNAPALAKGPDKDRDHGPRQEQADHGNSRGNSPSDPDNNGRGPDRDFDTNGPDKPAQGGDGNNGIGNDPDCGDDAENAKMPPGCLKRQTPTPTPTPPPTATPTATPTPTPTATPIPPNGEDCSRQIKFLNRKEVLEIYPARKGPGKGWLADWPKGKEGVLFHMRCNESIDLYWWTAEKGWTLIGTLTTTGEGPEIILDLDRLTSHLGKNYRFQLAAYHKVAAGETLFSLARLYSTTTEWLTKANEILNQNLIFVGQILRVA